MQCAALTSGRSDQHSDQHSDARSPEAHLGDVHSSGARDTDMSHPVVQVVARVNPRSTNSVRSAKSQIVPGTLGLDLIGLAIHARLRVRSNRAADLDRCEPIRRAIGLESSDPVPLSLMRGVPSIVGIAT